MKWPPSNCWTAPKTINGNRHFYLKNFGGKKDKRWVELFPTKEKIIIRVSWSELKKNWSSGWLQLPKDN
tara:strand:- start:183 stop:389 length:207 start_codon:yes stop_codon:yes gene_type:complete